MQNNLPIATIEVLFERPMEQRSDFMAIVPECSATPCPKDNGIVGVFHPDGQYLENTQPHGAAYFTTPLMDHFTGVYCRARDDSNRVGFIEKAAVIGAKDWYIGRIDDVIRVKRITA